MIVFSNTHDRSAKWGVLVWFLEFANFVWTVCTWALLNDKWSETRSTCFIIRKFVATRGQLEKMIAPLTQFRTMLFFVWWFACLSLDQVVSCSSQRKKCSTRKTCCSYGLETVQRGLDKAFGVVVWYSWQMHFTLTVCWFQKTIN